MASSTIPAFKRALLAALAARPGLSGVDITYGFPASMPGSEWIMVGGTSGEQTTRALGAQRRGETYDLTVVCSVLRAVDDQQGASERAFELAAEVEQACRADAGMGGTVDFAVVAGPFDLVEAGDAQYREGRVTLTIAASARI